MPIKKISKLTTVITVIGVLYSIYLIRQNPQPFGKLALLAFVIFGLTIFAKHKIVKRSIQGISIIVGLLLLVLGTRSLMFNITGEEFFESDTEVVFSKYSFSESLKKAETENKLLFVDFYTVWCGPCVTFHREVLNNEEVASYMNEAFINTKYNLYKGEGLKLKEIYEVYYVPRFLILDTKGNIVEDISTDSTLTSQRMVQISKKYIK